MVANTSQLLGHSCNELDGKVFMEVVNVLMRGTHASLIDAVEEVLAKHY